MPTTIIESPLNALACIATGDLRGNHDLDEAYERVHKAIQGEPPYLPKFLEQYPDRNPIGQGLLPDGEKILRMLARGDADPRDVVVPEFYTHFKGGIYAVLHIGKYTSALKDVVDLTIRTSTSN